MVQLDAAQVQPTRAARAVRLKQKEVKMTRYHRFTRRGLHDFRLGKKSGPNHDGNHARTGRRTT
ncbi:MAG: hypothetical protein ABIK47_04835, partial [candidate division WOR-3 bacterium]